MIKIFITNKIHLNFFFFLELDYMGHVSEMKKKREMNTL
jgi:hypothetical protein